MITAKNVTDIATAVAAFEPDIAIALTAYTLLKNVWMTMNPGKTEADFQTYLQTTSQANIDTTAAYLKSQGYVESTPGTWAKPTP